MKVLHLLCTIGISGAEKHLNFLLPGMSAYGYDCHLIIVHPIEYINDIIPLVNQLNQNNVKTALIDSKHAISLKVLKGIKSYLIDNDIKIIHSHLSKSDLLAVLLKQFFLKKLFIISTKHGYKETVLTEYDPANPKYKKNLFYYVTKYCLSKIDSNISISHCMSEFFISLNLSKEYFKVIHHGVDVDADDEELLEFKDGVINLVIVGRLEPYKGHKYVIEAMEIVFQHFPYINLLLLGGGSYKNVLQNLAEQKGIANNIKFLGFKPNALSYMKQAKLVIVPSLFEPFGLVFIEAIGLKKCVVAFDVPAGNEILNKECAQLVPKKDISALAEKIIELIKNESKLRDLERKAFNVYNLNYTTSIMIKKTAEHYKSLILPE